MELSSAQLQVGVAAKPRLTGMIKKNPFDTREISAVLFDMDDTLVASRRYWSRQVAYMLSREFVRRPWKVLATIQALRGFRRARESTRGHGPFACLRTEVLDRAVKATGLSRERIQAAVYPLIYETEFAGLDRYLFPGIADMVERLHREGLKVGVLSDYPVEAKLKAAGLDRIPWDLGMDCEQVGSLKPYPAAFHEAARRMGVEPGRVLYVGDREDTDVQGARAAGLKAVHVEHSRTRRANSLAADLILFRTSDLAEALGLI